MLAVGVVPGVDAQLVAVHGRVHGRVRVVKPVAAAQRLVGETLVDDELAHLGVQVLLELGGARVRIGAGLLAARGRLGHLVGAHVGMQQPNHKVPVRDDKRVHA